MKTKPYKEQIVYWIVDEDWIDMPSDIKIRSCIFHKFAGSWRFNLFSTRKEAVAARKKIVEILRG